MTAKEIRAITIEPKASKPVKEGFMLSMLQEIAAQLADQNELTRQQMQLVTYSANGLAGAALQNSELGLTAEDLEDKPKETGTDTQGPQVVMRKLEDMTLGELRSKYAELDLRLDRLKLSGAAAFSAERQSLDARLAEIGAEIAMRTDDVQVIATKPNPFTTYPISGVNQVGRTTMPGSFRLFKLPDGNAN